MQSHNVFSDSVRRNIGNERFRSKRCQTVHLKPRYSKQQLALLFVIVVAMTFVVFALAFSPQAALAQSSNQGRQAYGAVAKGSSAFGQPRVRAAKQVSTNRWTEIKGPQNQAQQNRFRQNRYQQGRTQPARTHQTYRQAQAPTRRDVSDQRTRLFFFTNHGCAPCKQVEPSIEALKGEGYPVETVYLGNDPGAAQKYLNEYGVTHTPTVVLISGGKLQGRHKGIDIDAVTLKKWFELVGVPSGAAFANAGNGKSAGGTKVVLSGQNSSSEPDWSSLSSFAKSGTVSDNYSSPTMIKGTTRPANANEQRAMQATVRLRVEDPEGISYATGTVIHNHEGECLVMTCGHVFRDAQGKGVITAEYGFETGNPKTAPGELIYYDANARDIGLVSIKTNSNIVPVPIADRRAAIARGQDIFSIGCDHGDSPTIRRSRIKNKAAYDGAVKYDIFGRPVDGRSGGGLFTADGELIGVCNAAAVEVDEGIYTALETVYWQIAEVNLDHLFENGSSRSNSVPARLASTQVASSNAGDFRKSFGRSVPRNIDTPRPFGSSRQRGSDSTRLAAIPSSNFAAGQNRTPVRWDDRSSRLGQTAGDSDKEVIIIVRSKDNPARTEAITVNDPTPELLNYLNNMQSEQARTRQLNMARMRTSKR